MESAAAKYEAGIRSLKGKLDAEKQKRLDEANKLAEGVDPCLEELVRQQETGIDVACEITRKLNMSDSESTPGSPEFGEPNVEDEDEAEDPNLQLLVAEQATQIAEAAQKKTEKKSTNAKDVQIKADHKLAKRIAVDLEFDESDLLSPDELEASINKLKDAEKKSGKKQNKDKQ